MCCCRCIFWRGNGTRLPSSDHSSRVLLRLHRRGCRMAGCLLDSLKRSNAISSNDDSCDSRKGNLRNRSLHSLFAASSLDVHARHCINRFNSRRFVFPFVRQDRKSWERGLVSCCAVRFFFSVSLSDIILLTAASATLANALIRFTPGFSVIASCNASSSCDCENPRILSIKCGTAGQI